MPQSINEEWIITNGIGGYASGTVMAVNSRRYHSLLVASFEPPTNRKILITEVEEQLSYNGIVYNLSTNFYPDLKAPNGLQFLDCFSAAPFPKWIYKNCDWELQKSILMVQQSNTILVNYKNNGKSTIHLELNPFYSFADFHTTFHQNQQTNFYSVIGSNEIKTYPEYGAIPLFTRWTAGDFTEARAWYNNIQLLEEKARGLDYCADSYRIGYLTKELKPNEELILFFSIDEKLVERDCQELFDTEKSKAMAVFSDNVFYNDLLHSGNQFVVNRKSTSSSSIIAGYHWFSDWGRDTMIAMRGLTIATNNAVVSRSILATFFSYIDQGMIPNRFPDSSADQIEYNTIDATLWLFVAVYEYYNKFQDLDFVKENLTALKSILDWHIKGTRYNIHVTPEGFLYGGEDGVQLTWMDAIVNGKVITPRIGCPVEINALWYNALKIYTIFCSIVELVIEEQYCSLIEKFESNFETFFINKNGTLHDVIIPNGATDTSFRPNQIYCLSLPFTVLKKEQQIHIFETIKLKLYTDYGLRTLEKGNTDFIGVYQGNQWQRDHAYHQGTVWPFLIAEYYEVFFKLYGSCDQNKQMVVDALVPLKKHFYQKQGMNCISEVFDGENPLEGKGTIQQAWSVAAIIKLYADYELYKMEDKGLA